MIQKMLQAVILSAALLFGQSHKDNVAGPFEKPQDVTKTCLECHETSAKEVMKTSHWTWLDEEFSDAGNSLSRMGKQKFINNFCIAVPSNYPRCTSCHIGYGWTDANFDFTLEENVDCLVCHDQTGTYKKVPTGAGMPDKSVDLLAVAQSVGKPSRKNCGICHFDGGGGAGVKHGDLDDSLYEPLPTTDVHMGKFGFACVDCHKSVEHKIGGASHGSMASGQNHIYCRDCHKTDIHKNKTLETHIKIVACETCHIPEFARVEPTKVWWDWSTAGLERPDVKDEFGKETYSKMKGDFKWARNVKPDYRWYNGQASYYQFGDIIDTNAVVKLNTLHGSRGDSTSRIAPFKKMLGKQIYDSRKNYLIVPKLFGEGGYWKNYDWNLASQLGMKEINLEYSGQFSFIETEMYWPINHMVASKDKALKCTTCHAKAGRMDWAALGYSEDPMKVKLKKKSIK
jgi:octaheme c-type cytochrome (tetrathionate reductase family)